MYSRIRTLSMLLVGMFVAAIATEPQARNNPAVGQQTFEENGTRGKRDATFSSKPERLTKKEQLDRV